MLTNHAAYSILRILGFFGLKDNGLFLWLLELDSGISLKAFEPFLLFSVVTNFIALAHVLPAIFFFRLLWNA
jgi:hypothetical protein